jgi:drug/metabolite transporter (DMT)-like permease
MQADAFLVVLASAVLHAIWNALAKGARLSDPRVNALLIGIGGGLVGFPLLLLWGLPAPASWPVLMTSALVHLAYYLLMGLAYRAADLSTVYPITRGTAPVGTALLGWMLLGEGLRPGAWIGVVLVGLGVVGMALWSRRQGVLSRAGLFFALANALVVVTYTLTDGQGARLSGNVPGYVISTEVLTIPMLLPFLFWHSRIKGLPAALASGVWWRSLLGGALSVVAYSAALWAMTRAPIGIVAALRETSVLFGVLIGAVVLRERVAAARWAAAGTIVVGVVLLKVASM